MIKYLFLAVVYPWWMKYHNTFSLYIYLLYYSKGLKLAISVCVCVCVCERERERGEKERKKRRTRAQPDGGLLYRPYSKSHSALLLLLYRVPLPPPVGGTQGIFCGYLCIYNFITPTCFFRFFYPRSTHVTCFCCSLVYADGTSC